VSRLTGRFFSPGPPVSSNNKTDHHDITEILCIHKIIKFTHKKAKHLTFYLYFQLGFKLRRVPCSISVYCASHTNKFTNTLYSCRKCTYIVYVYVVISDHADLQHVPIKTSTKLLNLHTKRQSIWRFTCISNWVSSYDAFPVR
jgi:hypothetical protein